MEECIFCKIIRGEIPGYKIYENDKVYAFLDISCDYYGHTLVVPKKHFANILDCDSEYLYAINDAIKVISKHYVEDCDFDGVNVVNNSGSEAGQSIMHLHFHIIPRRKNDGINILSESKSQVFDLEKIQNELKFK